MQYSRHSITQLASPQILVLGDLILDRYTFGDASRVSPEAPVLVLDADQCEVRPGGAASVATLVRGLDARVSLVGVVGPDHDGRTLRSVLSESQIDAESVVTDHKRITTTKDRFLGRTAGRPPYQMLRVDHEIRRPLDSRIEAQLIDSIQLRMPEFQAVLIADYAKGCCTPRLLAAVIEAARSRQIPVLIDPGRGRGLDLYRGATLIKPNRNEAEALTGLSIKTPDDGLQAARILCVAGQFDSTVVTLDQAGMVFATAAGLSGHVPTAARSVYDITGAGDMALAALGLAFAAGWPIKMAVDLANHAAGLEIERLGIEPISRAELAVAWQTSGMQPSLKIQTLDELTPAVERLRCEGKRIVFTNGCFDMLHAGHLKCLGDARALGDVLIVAINSDAGVRSLKGADRPLVNERERAELLAGLHCVDFVTVFDDLTPHRLLHALHPDFLAKGGTTPSIIGREVVEAYGGQVVATSLLPGRSTSELVQRLRFSRTNARVDLTAATAMERCMAE